MRAPWTELTYMYSKSNMMDVDPRPEEHFTHEACVLHHGREVVHA